MYEPTVLSLIGLVVFIIGFIMLMVCGSNENGGLKDLWISVFILLLGVILLVGHPAWSTWYLFLKNAASAVPTWAWIVAMVTIYFTLNHIYTAWLVYASQNQNGVVTKILLPWPLNIPPSDHITSAGIGGLSVFYSFGSLLFVIWWIIAIISYSAWLIFGGGIAKLLRLMPREPRS